MNTDRRKRLVEIADRMEDAFSTFCETIGIIANDIESLRNEEADYLDNMPENMQDSDKGVAAQEAVEHLEEAQSALDGFSMSSDMDEAVQHINDAQA